MTGRAAARQQIRTMHRFGFRRGEWADLLTIAPAPEVRGEASRSCYVVRFDDGATDFWVIGDPDGDYELRNALAAERRVVHCKRDAYDVYVGRPSKWGNPFTVKEYTRDGAIAAYAEWIETQPDLLAALPELRGKVLGCWCAPRACHGDVLAELANA